ncbi:Rv1815 family serine proteinase [Mycolicibacterium mengxianglii]|uniref:Rv1815 family serine proteinase n=1 Tax=Mycolicibacterium mengxianglii TaxID=2736649 RepID=UPI0018D1CE15|nr:hypothetical protein [Mycolicibacterium mengxianglii]
MRRTPSRSLVPSVLAVVCAALVAVFVAPTATAMPGPLVYPGMEILQGFNRCTLGYVDPDTRVAFSAGHCQANAPVTDSHGLVIGNVAMSEDNTPNGAVVTTDQVITDYQAIVLADNVVVNNVLPSGKSLESVPGRVAALGEPVCHFGIVTGESCGTIERVNNGWFTMTNGVVSQKGDSGGPVYVLDGDHAVVIGLFNSTWGTLPAAVSWQSTRDIVRAGIGDRVMAASAQTPTP